MGKGWSGYGSVHNSYLVFFVQFFFWEFNLMVSHSSNVLISHHLHYYKNCCILLGVTHVSHVKSHVSAWDPHTKVLLELGCLWFVGGERFWIPAWLHSRHMLWQSEQLTIFNPTDVGNLHLKTTWEILVGSYLFLITIEAQNSWISKFVCEFSKAEKWDDADSWLRWLHDKIKGM